MPEAPDPLDKLLREYAANRKAVASQIPIMRNDEIGEIVRILEKRPTLLSSSVFPLPRLAFGLVVVLVLMAGSYFYLFQRAGGTKVSDPFISGLDRHGNLVYRSSVAPVPTNLVSWIVAEINASGSVPPRTSAVLALQQIVSPLPQDAVLGTNHAPSKQIILESPVDTSVRSLPVTFRWQQVNGASEYVVILRNATTGAVLRRTSTSNKVEWEDGIDPDTIYQWQVNATVLNENAASLPARFRVLSAGELNALSALVLQFRESPLILAAIYRKFALEEENDQARAKFFQANPHLKTPKSH